MSSTTSSPNDATHTSTHTQDQAQAHAHTNTNTNNIHAVSPITTNGTVKNNTAERLPPQQPIQKEALLSANNHVGTSATATANVNAIVKANVNMNEVQAVNKQEKKSCDSDDTATIRLLQGEIRANVIQVEESSFTHKNNSNSNSNNRDEKKLDYGLGISPTKTKATTISSTLSIQGPISSRSLPLAPSKHGFGSNSQTQIDSSAPAPIQSSSQDLVSTNNVPTKGTTDGGGSTGIGANDAKSSSNKNKHNMNNSTTSTIKEGHPKPKNLKSGSATNHLPKNKKVRSRPTNGRPRSNSVPLDFQSTVKSKSTSPNSSSKSGNLRRGKWTVEEEAYVARVIQDFNSGYLNAPPGTTLRTYLSDKLNCDPMRITKKFTGDACIGKRVFHPAVRCSNNAALIDKAQSELDALERRWRKRLEMQQREVAKKQAASAAAAAAAVSGRMLHGKALHDSLRNNAPRAVVAQTASWLDRANAILSQTHAPPRSEQESKIVKTSSDEVEKEMKEVERLIHEGPIIQKTSAGLPTLLENSLSHDTSIQPTTQGTCSSSSISSEAPNKRKVSDDKPTKGMNSVNDLNGHLKQDPSSDNTASRFHDKRMRRSFSYNNVQDHEDAATLMGFLSSVRQAAASSTSSSK